MAKKTNNNKKQSERTINFYLLRLFEKSPISYNKTAFLIGFISIFLFSISLFCTDMVEFWDWIFSLFLPLRFFTIVVSLIFLGYLGNKIGETFKKIQPEKNTIEKFNKTAFRLQIIFLILGPVLAVSYYVYIWGTQTFSGSFPSVIANCIFAIFWYTIYFYLISLCLIVFFLYYYMEKDYTIQKRLVKNNVVFSRKIEDFFKPMVSLSLRNAFCLVIPISLWAPLLFYTLNKTLYQLGTLILVGIFFVIILYPLFSIHKMRSRIKTSLLERVTEKILEISRILEKREQASKEQESYEKLQLRFEIHKLALEETKNIKEWEISSETIITIFIVPLVSTLLPYAIKLLLIST